MDETNNRTVSVVCPCCSTRLTIDVRLQKVIGHELPQRKPDVSLEQAASILREQKARREAVFRQSEQDERTKADLLDRKFQEALKKSRKEPVSRPTRDIDLE